MNLYYEDTLYPLQDKVLHAIDALGAPFYLTGGTALSRCYLHHRYSDDLDFFTNTDTRFFKKAEEALLALEPLGIERTTRSNDFYSFFVGNILKIDFVNDTAGHVGEFSPFGIFSKVDSIENILANKISAIWGRDEPKDVADLWMIAESRSIDWQDVFQNVSSKASGIFPPLIAKKIATFPPGLLKKVKWLPEKEPSPDTFRESISKIIEDMLHVKYAESEK